MYTLQNTLYVMTPNAYAHLENNTLRIDVEREKRLQVPLHHIGSLVCFGNVMVAPALMHRLADEGKSLVLLEVSGRFKARLEGPVSGNILLRQAQHRSAADGEFALEFARAVIAGKLKNSRGLVVRAARETVDTDEQAALIRTVDNLAASLRVVAVKRRSRFAARGGRRGCPRLFRCPEFGGQASSSGVFRSQWPHPSPTA
ncbi:MAG: CRISPR-associated endonuclease Cas1 [Porticoccaceae bacterium]